MNVLITGANGGIGKALCDIFSKNKYKVIATDIHQKPHCQCTNYIQQDLREICKSSFVENKLKDKISQILNKEKLHALINNAAIQQTGKIESLQTSDWYESYEVNVFAPFLLIKMFMKDHFAQKGAIVNISSIHTYQTKKYFSIYSSSKSALTGMTKALALELAPDIRINSIHPAAVDTEMLSSGFKNNLHKIDELKKVHPIDRIATPDEVAELALFLCSEKSSFMTGSHIRLDGGIGSVLNEPT